MADPFGVADLMTAVTGDKPLNLEGVIFSPQLNWSGLSVGRGLSYGHARGVDFRVGTKGSIQSSAVELVERRTYIPSYNMQSANMYNANMAGAILDTCYLLQGDLRFANLTKASIRQSELGWAKVEGTNFTEADLYGTVFFDTFGPGTILRGASLIFANCMNADFREADLCGAIFTNAELSGVSWRGARFDSATVWPTHMDVDPVEKGAIKVS